MIEEKSVNGKQHFLGHLESHSLLRFLRGNPFLHQIGRAHVWTPVTPENLVCRLLLEKHAEEPFHALVGGGDQLYCDAVIREPEMQEWVTTQKPEKRMAFQMTQEMLFAIDRFFFNHYCQVFRSGAFARANSSMWVQFSFISRLLGLKDLLYLI